MSRHPVLLFSLAVLTAPLSASGQCLPTGSGSPGFGPDYVYLTPNAAMNAQSPAAVTNGVNGWRNACFSFGSSFGFPIPTTTPVSGASFASITVKFVAGMSPTHPQACARFPGATGGNTIDVFGQAQTPSGQTVQCSSYGYDFLIAHELGHFFRLADVLGSGCPSIMGQADGFPHSVTSNDCAVAEQMTQTPSENNPPPMCTEPCAGPCNSTGGCQATAPSCPILISLRSGRFHLSGIEDPVLFDIANEGEPILIGWTARGSDTALLALDRNGNGLIDDGTELFGDRTPLADGSYAANGFTALSQYDATALGGNGDFEIDAEDTIYEFLRLWLDDDHDAVTDAGELMPLAFYGISSISLESSLDRRRDRFGNLFWLRGSASRTERNGTRTVEIYDVTFVRR